MDLNTVRRLAGRALDRLDELADRSRPRLSNFERGARWRRHQAELRPLPGVGLLPANDNSGEPARLVFTPVVPTPPPPLPAALEKWTTLHDDPRREPVPAESRERRVSPAEAAALVRAGIVRTRNAGNTGDDGLRPVKMLLADDAPARRKWAAYQPEWKKWRDAEIPRRAAAAVHRELSELLPALRGDDDSGEPLEIFFGVGLARQRPGCNCAVAEIAADIVPSDSGKIIVRPRGKPVLALPHFAESPSRLLVADAFAKIAAGVSEPADPFAPDFLQPVLRAAREHLDPGAKFDDEHQPGDDLPAELTLHHQWFVAVRPREDSSAVKKAVGEFRGELEKAKTIGDIPEVLLRAALGPDESDAEKTGLVSGNPEHSDDFPSVPFSCNPEQARVLSLAGFGNGVGSDAKGVAGENGKLVSVCAPAASGATRTLANLICASLAKGERILVVSRERSALSDLREALPESVRPLAAAPLFGERENRRRVAAAARAFSELAAKTDPDKTGAELRECEDGIRKLQSDIAALERRDAEVAAPHYARPPHWDAAFAGTAAAPTFAHLAQWAGERRKRYEWFPDRPENPAPEDFAAVENLRAARGLLGKNLYSSSRRSDSNSSSRRSSGGTHDSDAPASGDSSFPAQAGIHSDSDRAMGSRFRGKGIDSAAGAAESSVPPLERRDEEDGDSAWVLESSPRRGASASAFGGGAFGGGTLPPEAESALPSDPAAVAKIMRDDRREAERTKWVGGLLRGLLADPDSSPEYRRVRPALRVLERRRRMLTGVRHPDLRAVLSTTVASALSRKASWLRFWLPTDAATRKTLDGFRVDGHRPRRPREWRRAREFAGWLSDFSEFAAEWNQGAARGFKDSAARAPEDPSALPGWSRKTDGALRKMESALRCATALRESVSWLAAEVARAGAPKWAKALSEIPAPEGEADPLAPKDWRDAWRWGCAEAALGKLRSRKSPPPSDDVLREKRGALAALRARACDLRIALSARKVARPEWAGADGDAGTDVVLDSLPCAIAPSWRAHELAAKFGAWDVVATDRASQSPAADLALLLRGKRAVVLGDDARFAPAVFGEELSAVSDGGGVGGSGTDANLKATDSVYDFARRARPGTGVFLREVYGTAWAIAEVASRLFYDGRLAPVYFPTGGESVGPPLAAVHVPKGVRDGGRNEWEARALVSEMDRIFGDPRAAGRSAGIAALSDEQAALARTAAEGRFGAKALAGRDFVCDEAEAWGGRRRDIGLVSLADSPGRGDPPTGAGSRRRLLLALGVGRLQLRLAHSVSREDLRNPDDLRRALLERFWARGAARAAAEDAGDAGRLRTETAGATEFERDLFSRLREAGYAAAVATGAPGCRVAIAVEGGDGSGSRLGAELDGGDAAADWGGTVARRRALERGGWKFWRGFAADYVRDPEGVFADLRSALSAAGISPSGGEVEEVSETRVFDPGGEGE